MYGINYNFLKPEDRARHAIDFIQQLKHTKGKWAGEPFILFDWQRELIEKIFGTIDKNGYRIIRKCYVEIPKKNGKSEIAAAIALYLLFADRESGAEIYSAASDRDQAAIVFDVAAQMVRYNPALSKRCRIIDSRKRIVIPPNNFYHVLSADVQNKHGFNTHGVIFDELHTQPKRDLWDVLTEGAGDARLQPLIFAITTAGYDRESICWEVHQYAEKVRNGIIEDPHFYSVVYSLPEKEDWESEKNWYKVNPSLDKIIDIDKVRTAYGEAKEIPAKQNTFRRLRLNQWTQQSTRWIDMAMWDKGERKVDEESLTGNICYGGLDLSAVSDITAWVMVFPYDDSNDVDVLCRLWCPEERLYEASNKYQNQYRLWKQQGFLKTTPGDAIDYAFVKKQIIEDAKKFNIQSMNIDRLFQGFQLAMELEEELAGITDVATMGMGFTSMAAPVKDFEGRVLKGLIHHGGNPVLRWMMDNLVVKVDEAGNYKPDKRNSQGKIDGIVALIMALERLGREQGRTSVYDTRGLVVI